MKTKFCAEIIVLFFIGTGCATYGEIEKDFGKAYTLAKYGQILNPGASQHLKPVTGLSGTAAEAVIGKYTESFSPLGRGEQTPRSFAITPIIPTEDTGSGPKCLQ